MGTSAKKNDPSSRTSEKKRLGKKISKGVVNKKIGVKTKKEVVRKVTNTTSAATQTKTCASKTRVKSAAERELLKTENRLVSKGLGEDNECEEAGKNESN